MCAGASGVELVALNVAAGRKQADDALARRRPGVACAQRLGDVASA